jgi:hypothetical protein
MPSGIPYMLCFKCAFRRWFYTLEFNHRLLGGDNVVDPRVIVYHYYKKLEGRSFAVDSWQYTSNCLYVASRYFPYEIYMKVHAAVVNSSKIMGLEHPEHRQFVATSQSRYIRRFEHWVAQFATELREFLEDTQR